MELLSLPRLRNNQLQTVSEDSIKICAGLTQLEEPLQTLTLKLNLFKDGMTKEKASAASKKGLDNYRDRLVMAFIKSVKAETFYPYSDDAAKEVLNKLLEVVDKYGTKIIRLSYNEESAAIDNMIADLNKIDFAPLANSGLARWIPFIEDSNNIFKNAVANYIDESADSTLVDSATAIAPELSDALEGLYTMMYAFLKINASPELKKAYAQIHILLNSYR